MQPIDYEGFSYEERLQLGIYLMQLGASQTVASKKVGVTRSTIKRNYDKMRDRETWGSHSVRRLAEELVDKLVWRAKNPREADKMRVRKWGMVIVKGN